MKFCCKGVRGSRVITNSIDDYITRISRVLLNVDRKTLHSVDNSLSAMKQFLRDAFSRVEIHSLLGYGSNTPCVQVNFDSSDEVALIFDLGSGCSNITLPDSVKAVHIFFTHFHYDHIAGLPFSSFLQKKDIEIHFYSPVQNFEPLVHSFLDSPFFPINLEKITSFNKNISFHSLYDRENLKILDNSISWKKLNHPGAAYAYKVEENSKSFCYFTDVHIIDEYFHHSIENKKFLQGIDKMIIDASLNYSDSLIKNSWGHTSIYEGMNLANEWDVKNLYFFHYDPEDSEIDTSIAYQTLLWYKKLLKSKTKVYFSIEEQWVQV